jgi:hypothetical protein
LSKDEKLVLRFLSDPKDFVWSELVRLLRTLGYFEISTGVTGGSRRKFADDDQHVICLHKPHPGNIVKSYVIREVKEHLHTHKKLKKHG